VEEARVDCYVGGRVEHRTLEYLGIGIESNFHPSLEGGL
jgi:hypothetical protein